MIIHGVKLHEGNFPGHHEEFIFFTMVQKVAEDVTTGLNDFDVKGKWGPAFKIHEVTVEADLTEKEVTKLVKNLSKQYIK